MAMTKPLPYGCIKHPKKKKKSLKEVEELIKSVTLEDKKRHFYS